MNNEFERIWKEEGMTFSRYESGLGLERLWKTTKT
jgi:hypothetical protein